jgi:hypothetical protein
MAVCVNILHDGISSAALAFPGVGSGLLNFGLGKKKG